MWQMYDIDPEADIIQNNNSSHHNSSSSSSSSSERVGRVLGGEASMWGQNKSMH